MRRSPTLRRTTLRVAAVAALLVANSNAAFGWSGTAHRVIARVADARLSRRAQAAVRDILGRETLADVAALADEWRAERPETARYHYVDIPVGGTYTPERDCESTPEGDCVVAAIERYRAVLADAARPASERREALIFLVHLVGDAGQPLHASEDQGDRGGNLKRVCLLERCTGSGGQPLTLHGIWDYDLVAAANLSERKYAKKLRRTAAGLSAAEVESIVDGGPIAWVEQSNQQATATAYGLLPPPDGAGVYHLTSSYASRARAVVDRQLLVSAVRLAAVLNTALDPGQAG